MLYTKKGDQGTTGLFDTKERFYKDSPVYEALGTLDELNSFLGICRASFLSFGHGRKLRVSTMILEIQQHLFIIQAEIAGAQKIITDTQINRLEKIIDLIEKAIRKPDGFVIPGSTEMSAQFDFARAICRRAERRLVALFPKEVSPSLSLAYLNRLSSLFYALARHFAAGGGDGEDRPAYN